MSRVPAWFLSELAGTFLLVFFGCGAVATSVALGAPVGLFQVAVVWGLGLSVAIFLSAHHSGAHLNPAITLAFAVVGDFPKRRVPGYIAAQFLGAFLAAGAVYLLFGGAIHAFESANGIVRGTRGSEASAMIFGEYFPNPGAKPLAADASEIVSHGTALFGEFLGTLLLAFIIFGFVAKQNSAGPGPMTPIAIGIALTTLICIFAPLTMAGFNPARDLAPRLFSSLVGWGGTPFATNGIGWLTVYVIAPCGGAITGGFFAKSLFEKPAASAV
jgi:glycerol uptake facilitator protein